MSLGKRLVPITIVLALALCLAPGALADPTPAATTASPTAQAFTCLGAVTAVAPSTGSVTIAVSRASLALQGSLGQRLTLAVTSTSSLTAISHGVKTQTTLAGVAVGELLSVSGTIDATNPAALVYDIGKACAWRPSFTTAFLCQGTVSSVDLQTGALLVHVARGSSSVCDRTGATVTVDVPGGAKIFVLQGRLATATTICGLTAGDNVYVTGKADRVNPSVTMFIAGLVLVRHVVLVSRPTWFACLGQVTAVDRQAGTLTVSVARGTLGVPSGSLALATIASSVVHTLSNGVLETVKVADVPVGESIVVTGTIDHSRPGGPIFDIGQAFVWRPAN